MREIVRGTLQGLGILLSPIALILSPVRSYRNPPFHQWGGFDMPHWSALFAFVFAVLVFVAILAATRVYGKILAAILLLANLFAVGIMLHTLFHAMTLPTI